MVTKKKAKARKWKKIGFVLRREEKESAEGLFKKESQESCGGDFRLFSGLKEKREKHKHFWGLREGESRKLKGNFFSFWAKEKSAERFWFVCLGFSCCLTFWLQRCSIV